MSIKIALLFALITLSYQYYECFTESGGYLGNCQCGCGTYNLYTGTYTCLACTFEWWWGLLIGIGVLFTIVVIALIVKRIRTRRAIRERMMF